MNEIWTKNTTKKGATYTLRFHYGRSEKGAYLWKKITAKTKMEARQKRDQFEIRMGTASRNVIIKQSFLSYLSIWGEVYYKNSVKEMP